MSMLQDEEATMIGVNFTFLHRQIQELALHKSILLEEILIRDESFHCSSVRSRVCGIPMLMPGAHSGAAPVGDGWRNYFLFADHSAK